MASQAMKVIFVILPIVFFFFNLTVVQTSLLAITLLVLGFLINGGSNGDYRLPKGPQGLPLIGSLPSALYQGIDEYFLYLSQKYGKMVTVKFGGIGNILINDYETMKEFSLHPDFQGRPKNTIVYLMMNGFGIIDSEGSRWKHQRRFMMHALRDSGMGKINMEEKIISQLEIVSSKIAQNQGKPFSMDVLLEKATCNVIFGLAFNKVFDYDDPIFISRIHKLNENVQLIVKLLFFNSFKKMKLLYRKSLKQLLDNVEYMHEFASESIDEHRQSLDKDNPRDFLDLYLTELNKEATPDNRDYQQTFSENQLKCIFIDMFAAGTETSSTTIRWAILYMMHYPEIQKQVQKEIDDVIGTERAPTVADKLNLPYTVATLQEVERLGSVAPRAAPRSNPAPAKFREYSFPERCLFLFNIYAIHRDPNLWDNPEEFRPERFISNEGKVFRPPYLVPFGSGKRACAGESLAKLEIYLFFVCLMQKFTFLPPDGKLPKMDAVSGIVRGPVPFKVVARPRT